MSTKTFCDYPDCGIELAWPNDNNKEDNNRRHSLWIYTHEDIGKKRYKEYCKKHFDIQFEKMGVEP